MKTLRRLAICSLALCCGGCDVFYSQMRADLKDEGIADPWVIDKTWAYSGESMLAALDGLHPLGDEYCIATRHLIPIAPHPLSAERKRQVRNIRAIAWAPCYAVRADQFRDIDGTFAEADILAALTAVRKFARSGPEAVTDVRVERPLPPAAEIAQIVRPEKFCAIASYSDSGFASLPHGTMEIGFNADPEGRLIDPLSFSVRVANGKVASIMVWRLYTGGCQ